MGDPEQRLTLTKQRCLGVARQPMKISRSSNFMPIKGLLGTSGRRFADSGLVLAATFVSRNPEPRRRAAFGTNRHQPS
jgi:hypothetical protein